MRVKRYVVESMPDAMQRIRGDLGQDAVILNTKEIRSGGFLGLFAKRKIEVIAAVDAHTASSARTVHRPAAVRRQEEASREQARASIEEQTAAASAARFDAVSMPLSPAKPPSGQDEQRDELFPPASDLLMEEVKQMKRLMLRIAGEPEQPELPPSFAIWKNRLVQHEFAPPLVEAIMDDAIRNYAVKEGEPDDATAAALVREQLERRLAERPIHEIADDTRIVQFVGPTGVGKTTTIAKLAAMQVLKRRRNVAFVTADTYRIAAVEQLRTYANILDVPLEVVNSRQDMLRALDRFADKDLVFMDTAGRNFRNEMFVSETNSLLGSINKKSETYLVLSMTMKYKDMLAVANNFAQFQVKNVLFTKLDETDSYGAVFNLLADTDYQPSYVTNGQNVPEDIGKLHADRLIEFIMEETTDG